MIELSRQGVAVELATVDLMLWGGGRQYGDEMTDIEIPDNEDAACALDDCIPSMAREGSYHWVEACRSAARRLRADAEEIARLHEQINRDTECIREVQAELNRVYELRDDLRVQLETARTEAAAQRELATLLERESTDPLTRIAAALERPSREWVAALIFAAIESRDNYYQSWEDQAGDSIAGADALLAEMGEK